MTRNFDSSHEKRKFQLIVAISGDTKEDLFAALSELYKDIRQNKPLQGIFLNSEGTTEIITPMWDGKTY